MSKKHLKPTTFFLIGILLTILLSGILSFIDVQANGVNINRITNEMTNYVISVNSLLSVEGIKYMLSSILTNFLSFIPLGTLIMSLIALGVFRKTEFQSTMFTIINSRISKKTLTFLIIFISMLSSIYIDYAYVFLIPISAMLFIHNNRNPLIGIIASFTSIAAGYGITLMVGSLDSTLSAYTSIASRLLDNEYGVTIWSNIFVMILGTFLMAHIGTMITEKITVLSVGKYKVEDDELFVVGKEEYKAYKMALLSLLIMGIVLFYAIIPGLPLSGFLLDNEASNYVNKLLGTSSTFYKSGVFIFSLVIIISSFVYGHFAKTIKAKENIFKGILDDIGNMIMLIFVAAQFIAFFKYTNIGPFVTATLTNIVGNLELTGIPLILVFLLIVMISNLLLTSPVSKWMIMSPIIVPMLMRANISPEFTQLIFRVGQSTTNAITPMLAYFIIYLAFLDKYNINKDKQITVLRSIKYAIPYNLAYFAMWLFIILTFYIVGLPIGIDATPTI